MPKKKTAKRQLTPELAEIAAELAPTLDPETPPSIIEALAIQVKTMRDARELIDKDGLIVRDTKGNAVEHPALAVERTAAKTIDTINKTWAL